MKINVSLTHALQDWFADDWITGVYQPRTYRMEGYQAVHTYEQGTRYNRSEVTEFDMVQRTVDAHKVTLNR